MQYTKFEVNEKLNAIDVPCGPILDTSDIIDGAHLQVREMIVDVPHLQRGTFKTVAVRSSCRTRQWRSHRLRCWVSIRQRSCVR